MPIDYLFFPPLLLLEKLPLRLDVLGLLVDFVDDVEPSFLRMLPELDDDEVDQLPVDLLELELLPDPELLDLPELELDPVLPELDPVLPALPLVEPPETEPFEVKLPVRSLVVGFFSSLDDEEEVWLFGTDEYPL
ncbi:hypothetical protein GCM10020370_06910 [Paenibacillus hodogayensis]